MKEERLAILKMVEDGKINADDAVKLLAALSKGKKSFEGSEWQSGLEDKVKAFAKNMDEMSRELGKKLEEVGKDVEPAIKKVAQTIITKTSECVDEISNAFKKDEECCCGEDGEAKEGEEGCCCGCEDGPKEN